MSWPALVALLLVALAVAAMCAGAETGFYAFSRLRHRLELERETPAARRLERLLARPDRLLAALLLGTTVALETATLCTQALLDDVLRLSPSARATIGALVATPLLFVFVEALPKHAFLSRPYVMLARCSWPLDLLLGVLRPIASLLAGLASRVQRAGGGGAGEAAAGVEGALQHGLREGLLTRTEHLIAANVLRLGDLTVSDLALPLSALPRVASGATQKEWGEALRDSRETRALVVDGRTQEVVGLIHAFDLALAIADGKSEISHDVRAIPTLDGDESIASALGRMHRDGLALTLVRGARGRPLQLLRLEDVVEELCGPLTAPDPKGGGGR